MADHPRTARREDVQLLIEEIEGQLDSTLEADEVRAILRRWVRDFGLEDDPRSDIEDFPKFLLELQGLAYAGPRAVQVPQASGTA
jgi:hypothetical protein